MDTRRMSVLVAVVVAVNVGARAEAVSSKRQLVCQTAIAKAGAKLVAAELRLRQRCIEATLKAPGSCAAPNPAALARMRARLDVALAKRCDFGAFAAENLAMLGYPGPCEDAEPGDGFTIADLQACIRVSHEARLTGICVGGSNTGEPCADVQACPDIGPGAACRGLLALQYDMDAVGPASSAAMKCARRVVDATTKHVRSMLASVQRCRSDLLKCRFDASSGEVVCKLSGFAGEDCASVDPGGAIAASAARLAAAIRSACTDAELPFVGICEPDQPTVEDGIACLLDGIARLVDHPDDTGARDLIDYEYPE